MAEVIVTPDGSRLALTEAELSMMQAMVDAQDRGGFYAVYNAMTDTDQSSMQGRISTFVDQGGGAAYVANRLMQDTFAPDGYDGIFRGLSPQHT